MARCRRLAAVAVVIALMALAGRGAPAVRAQDDPMAFRGGAGKAFLGPVNLQAGLLVLRARHSGTGNFTVWLELPKDGSDPEQNWESNDLLINTIGRYDGAAAIGVQREGSYLIWVQQASGAYQITLEQPTGGPPDTAAQREFSGKGQQVSPVFVLPAGTVSVTVAYEGSLNIDLWLFDMFGGAIGALDYTGRFLHQPGPYTGTVTLDIPSDGPYLLYVDAASPVGDGRWTVRIDGP